MTRSQTPDYVHLRAWCRMMGSYAYYVEAQLEAARRSNAPADAIYRSVDARDAGRWRTFAEVTDASTREVIERLVEAWS